MSAIFGFTFHIGRMTEVLTPDIYRAHWVTHVRSSHSKDPHPPNAIRQCETIFWFSKVDKFAVWKIFLSQLLTDLFAFEK